MSINKFAIAVFLALLVCGPVLAQQLDIDNSAVIQYDSLQDWTRVRMYADDHQMKLKSADLDKREIAAIFRYCRASVANYNKRFDTIPWFRSQMADPSFKPYRYKVDPNAQYFVQMVPVTQQNGDKVVFVICLCTKDWPVTDDMRKNTVEVIDLGTCHFQLKVNLTTGKVFDMWVDGGA